MKNLLVCLCLFCIRIFPQTGSINGVVTDARTREPLPGANIIINEIPNTGTSANDQGNFRIKVPAGNYSLRISLLGYIPVIKTDVIVRSGSEVRLNVLLEDSPLQLNEISVKAEYFDRSLMENSLSTISLGAEEVKRSPGSLQDFQRILQSLAGVSFSRDKSNELLVRGGAPDENLTILDNMEIHSTNHFPNERNSAGPINMINVDLIEDIRFSTGGFISKYGDKLSSVINITTREGTLEPFKANLNFSSAGLGAILEGGFPRERGSWILSMRKSYMDLIKGPVGLTSVPEYYDLQLKLAYCISMNHRITFSGIYGNDKNFTEGEPENSDPMMAGKIDSVNLTIEDLNQYQYAAGAVLRNVWSSNFFSQLTIFTNSYYYNNSETDQFTERSYDNLGDVSDSRILRNYTQSRNRSTIRTLGAKFEGAWNITKTNEIEFGIAGRTEAFAHRRFTGADSVRFDKLADGWNTTDDLYLGKTASETDYKVDALKNYKSYAFINDRISLFQNKLELNLGLRYDYFTYSGWANVSPRLSATYFAVPGVFDINAAYGEYYQSHSYLTYIDRYHTDVNKSLKNTHSRHFVFGFNFIPDDGLKLTIETYQKRYNDIPVSEEFIHSNDRTFRSERYINTGVKSIYGFDVLLQQKLAGNYYGTLSYSKMWSRMNDPRLGKEDGHYPSDYDFPHILTVIFGRRFTGMRERLDREPFYIKYPGYLIFFSNDMEISLRWRYASGKPYTPKVFITTEQFFEGGSRWSRGTWVPTDEINLKRYPDYHRLDFSISGRFNFEKRNLSVYFSIENLYNRENIASYQYNSDGSRENKTQYSFLPVLGIELDL